ncbi:cytochrome P450 [Sparassis latifolia]
MVSLIDCLLCAFATALLLFWRGRRTTLPLPPGPPADPIIGHLRVFSPAHQHLLFQNWAAQYGDIFHLNILGQPLIVLNSVEVATDLLEKRGTNYSDRPTCTTFELMGWHADLALMPYGPRWRKHRKMFQEYFNPTQCLSYIRDQAQEAHDLLKALLRAPEQFVKCTKSYTLSSIMRIVYGHRVLNYDNDVYIELAVGAMHALDEAAAGISLLDLFPSLQHVPHWFPGFSFLTAIPRRFRPITRRLREYPFEDVRKQMEIGVAQPSFVSSHLEHLGSTCVSDEELEDVKGAAALIATVGFDTTWTLIQMFIFTMLLFPEAQRKAQSEIDRVVGLGRLPCSSDRGALPFVECVLQETMRWHPVAPFGVAHKSRDEDEYKGMLIPKGSIIIPNVMAMSRDERIYKDADSFYPERFLPTPAGRGEPHFSAGFGFGRRICPGRHFANNSAWLVVASILATFDITKAVREDGSVIEPKVEFTMNGQVSRPLPFKCTIRPRSEEAKELINRPSD